MRFLDHTLTGISAGGWVVDEVEGYSRPLDGIDLALRGLGMICDWLDGLDPSDAADVQAVLVGLGHVDAAALAALSGTIVQAETAGCAAADGHASPSSWVGAQLQMTGAAASRACRLAADLDDLPEAVASLRAGQISRDHATTLADALRQQRRDQAAAAKSRRDAERQDAQRRRDEAAAAEAAAADEEERKRVREQARREEERRRAEAEEAERRRAEQAEADRQRRAADLLDAARAGGSPEDVAEEAARQRAADADALRRDEAAHRAGRYYRHWTDRETGAARGTYSIPHAEQGKVLALLEALRTYDEPDCDPVERRTFEQRQADAFLDLIDTALRAPDVPTSRGQKPHITVMVPLDVLAGGEGTGRTRHGATLSAQAARRIACDAALTRVVLSATSQVLDVGRETRSWTTAQYKAAELTFGGCAFPTSDNQLCGRPPQWCDLHHVHYWRHGGHTDQDNGVLLCRRHHDNVHHGWTLTYDHPAQTITVTRQATSLRSVIRRTVNLAHPSTGGATRSRRDRPPEPKQQLF